MKKLLFITWTFSMGGGAEKMLSTLTRSLPEDKYEIDILEIGKFGMHEEKINKNTKVLKPILNDFTDNKLINFIKWQCVKYFPYLLRAFRTKNKKYDYEIAFNYLYPVYSLRKNRKTIAWNHGSVYNLLQEDTNRKKMTKSLAYVNKIIAISDLTYASLETVFPMYSEKMVLLHNGYDFDEILLKSNEIVEKPIEKDNLIFIGRVEKNKGIIELLDLFLEVVKIIPNKKLYILGTGELDSYVQEFIKEHSLQNNIFPLGYVSNPYPYIKSAAFIMMLSYAEGFPTVFVEGLSLGVGFVSTPVGGVNELSNNGQTGFVANNKDSFKNYLVEELQKNKEDRIIKSETCKKLVQKYDVSEQVKKFEKILEGI